MDIKSFDINSNGILLKGTVYIPAVDIKGIVLIVHGMAEHRKRYNDFCTYLSSNNYVSYVYDQRGHGETSPSIDLLGYMDDFDNLKAMIEDVKNVCITLKNKFPNKPIILFGHSMGSFISQRYHQLYPETIDALILSGTNYTKNSLYTLGRFLAKAIVLFKGRKYKSKFLDKMSFGSYNKHVKNPKTQFDWLSLNEENVNAYIKDEYCGNLFTCSYFYDLLNMFKDINKGFRKKIIDKPIYLFSGTHDPVGNMGKGVIKLKNKYLKKGIKDIEMNLYNPYRHEMLNEENKHEVYKNVIIWLEKHV